LEVVVARERRAQHRQGGPGAQEAQEISAISRHPGIYEGTSLECRPGGRRRG
jgi:hypothetical protein